MNLNILDKTRPHHLGSSFPWKLWGVKTKNLLLLLYQIIHCQKTPSSPVTDLGTRADGHQPSSQKWVSQHLSLRITRVRPSLLPFNTLNIKDFWSTSQQALLGITVCFEFNKTAELLRWMTVSKNVFIPPFVFPSIKVTAFETRGIAYFLLQSCLFHEKQWFLAILDQILHLWWKEFGGNSFIKNAEYDQKC